MWMQGRGRGKVGRGGGTEKGGRRTATNLILIFFFAQTIQENVNIRIPKRAMRTLVVVTNGHVKLHISFAVIAQTKRQTTNNK